MHNAEVDVNYAIYYPLLKPYASLYPKSRKEKSEEPEDEDTEDKSNREVDGPKGDLDMWKTVEEAMANGTLDALRNSKEGMPSAPAPVPKKQEKKKEHGVKSKSTKTEEKLAAAKNRRERRALGAQAQEEAEESDGGFFE